MKKNTFLHGKGLPVFLLKVQINNLYKPSSRYHVESFDYIHVKDFFVNKQFGHILLKEWYFLLKPTGYLVIDYVDETEITFEFIKSLLWWLCKGNYDIVYHEKENGYFRVVIKKDHAMFKKSDAIEKWTFGIVTNGDRNDWVDMIITSIRNQKIPNYEIIICGTYFDRKEKDIIYIPFSQKSDKGWITKKKNLICKKAKFENICIVHDRLLFDKGWYQGMKKFGNAFELLGCIQKEKTEVLAGDWLTLGGPVGTHYKVSSMKYTDWDYYTYLSGQLTIIKKHIWEQVKWDETRFWNDAEDADISFRSRDLGYIIRFNPYSTCTALSWRHGQLPLRYDLSQGLLPKDMYLRRIMRLSVRILFKFPSIKKIIYDNYYKIAKTKLYKHFIYN